MTTGQKKFNFNASIYVEFPWSSFKMMLHGKFENFASSMSQTQSIIASIWEIWYLCYKKCDTSLDPRLSSRPKTPTLNNNIQVA